MVEDHRSEFKIRIDEDEPARSLFHSEVENQQINKLRRRITFMSIFTLCLLAIALTYAYIDIKKQVGSFHTSDTRDVESRFSSLSVKYAELEAEFSNKITTLETTVAALKTGLDKSAVSLHKSSAALKKTLQTIQTSKADKKQIAGLKKEIAATVAAFNEDTENISGMLKSMDDETAATLSEFQKAMASADKEMADLQSSVSDLAGLSARQPTKKEIKANLRDQSLIFQNQVDELTTLLNRNDDKIEALISRMDALKKDFAKIAGIVPGQPGPALPIPTGLPDKQLPDDSATDKDSVKEQNIQ
jgi:septal ring factor EnvC (AmiA/AmiB activator)